MARSATAERLRPPVIVETCVLCVGTRAVRSLEQASLALGRLDLTEVVVRSGRQALVGAPLRRDARQDVAHVVAEAVDDADDGSERLDAELGAGRHVDREDVSAAEARFAARAYRLAAVATRERDPLVTTGERAAPRVG